MLSVVPNGCAPSVHTCACQNCAHKAGEGIFMFVKYGVGMYAQRIGTKRITLDVFGRH